ncbi:MAG: methyltransferase domain-containing protein [Candidatus Hodarchaeales archaeon]|jgi:hypothetical protein
MKNGRTKEHGDFQTPVELTREITSFLQLNGVNPASIIEPTCGLGSFIFSAVETYPNASVIGIDINPDHLNQVQHHLEEGNLINRVQLLQADFFKTDWKVLVSQTMEPILILGNPPWITNAEMSSLGGSNVPLKSNIHGFKGLDARTGMSNFDISEWMIVELLKSLDGLNASLAMLCKVNVARKVLLHSFKKQLSVSSSSMHLIDAQRYFDVSVDACLLTCHLQPRSSNSSCQVFENMYSKEPIHEIGHVNRQMIANIPLYNKWQHLQGKKYSTWRSGIKHDRSRVMELKKRNGVYYNGFNEIVSIEDSYLYPMLKSSDLANNRIDKLDKWMLVTQKSIGEDTSSIKDKAPRTWEYLEKYGDILAKRASSVYKNQPPYSIFGIGPYAFSRWKVAISGFYKKIDFRLVHPLGGKPVVLDDTCYFLPCESLEEATVLFIALNHPIAKEFYKSYIFWDAKRPITKKILQKLDLGKLMLEIGPDEILQEAIDDYSNLDSKALLSEIKKSQKV